MCWAALAMGQDAASSQQKPQPQAPPAGQENAPAATFSVNVKLVNVFATVTDKNGAPIANLKKDDFRVFEDGKPQKISVFAKESELPLSIVMGVDASLSTRKDLPLELESARRFAKAILRPIDAMSVYEFSEVVNELVSFTPDLKKVDRGLSRVKTGAATALYDAVYLGSAALQDRQGRKVMVVITDGGDTMSQVSYQEAVRAAQISEAILYAIIMVPIEASAGRDLGGEHALIQITKDTGGKYYYAKSIDQLDEAFKQISDELRTQYLIAYYPPKKADGDFRRIQIEVDPNSPDLPKDVSPVVRHRTGYYTSKLQ